MSRTGLNSCVALPAQGGIDARILRSDDALLASGAHDRDPEPAQRSLDADP